MFRTVQRSAAIAGILLLALALPAGAVAAGPPQPTVTAPNSGGTFTQGTHVPVAFTLAEATSTGVFHIYCWGSDNTPNYLTSKNAVAGQTAYTYDWTVTQPAGAGYVIRVWYVDGAGNWLYVDSSDTSFAIAAAASTPQPTVTAPNSGGSFTQGTHVPVAFTLAGATASGVFHVYCWGADNTPHYLATKNAVSGQTTYAYDWIVTQPAGTGYVIRVWYVDGSGNWLYVDSSDASFTIAAAPPQPTVTAPNGGDSFTQGTQVSVGFALAGATASGVFHIYCWGADGTPNYLATLPAVDGQTIYTYDWTVTQPAGIGDVIRVWYVDGAGNWLYVDSSDTAFAITPAAPPPQPTVTAPNGGGSFAQGTHVPVAFTLAGATASGVFHVYCWGAGGTPYHLTSKNAVSGQTSYTYDWTVTQPAGTGYVVRVWYVDGAGNWLHVDSSDTAFAITTAAPPPQPTVTAPNSGGSFAQGSVVPVSFTLSGAASTGVLHIYCWGSDNTPHYLTSKNAVAGQTTYTYDWTVNQPSGTGYVIRVWYVDGAGSWLYVDSSNAAFTISADIVTKNIILLISDGQGYNQKAAADLYQYGTVGTQVYEQYPVSFAVSTFSVGSYDPAQAWSSWDYVTWDPTDSAAAATAMATGVKTYDAAVGVDVDGNAVKSILERAEELGKATGVITTVEFSHATPAGFVVHNVDRNNYQQIAQEMLLDSATDVIMGAGNPWYTNSGTLRTTPNPYDYVGGTSTWNALVSGTAGADADGDGIADPWTLIQKRADFQALMSGATPKRVSGVFRSYTTAQQARGGDAMAAPYVVPLNANVPTLAEMTKGALNVLDNDDDGLFLMVEGGAVDWAAHANEPGRLIEEQIDFNRALEAVDRWVNDNSNWQETLVIVTADHETGYLWGPGSGPAAGGSGTWNALLNRGVGSQPGMLFSSGNHTNSLVPLYAKGDAAQEFEAGTVRVDSVRGPYVDNTDVARVMFRAFAGG